MLRKTVVVPPPKTVTVSVVDPVDMHTLRQELKHQVLTMSVQAELQFATQVDVLTGESKHGRLGLLPVMTTNRAHCDGESHEAPEDGQAQGIRVNYDKMAREKADRTNERLINAMEAATGEDIDGDGDIGR